MRKTAVISLTPSVLVWSGLIGLVLTEGFFKLARRALERLRDSTLDPEIVALKFAVEKTLPDWKRECDAAASDLVVEDVARFATADGDLRPLGLAIRYSQNQRKRLLLQKRNTVEKTAEAATPQPPPINANDPRIEIR